MTIAVNLSDYKTLAKKKLSTEVFDFIDSGACDEITKCNNRNAFNDITIRPLCLRDVSKVDLSTELLGRKIACPILIGPTAFHKLVDKNGEISTAKAAKNCMIPMVVSAMSNISLEEISENSRHDNLWMQVYIFKNREITINLIRRAEKAGYKAILVTVGSPQMGKRDRNIRNRFSLPPELFTGNFQSANSDIHLTPIYNFAAAELDPSLTWKDIEWVQKITNLPIIIKGIMNALDAKEACLLNVAGIVISNHGGRQLDTTEATINVLPEIASAVSGRTLVMLDSGIRRGTDILKAIALGAHAVLLGRPILWALAVNGKQEVVKALDMLTEEFEISMKLSGCHNVEEIKKNSIDLIRMKYLDSR